MKNVRKTVNLVLIVFFLDCDANRGKQQQLLDMFGRQLWIFYSEHENKIRAEGVANEGGIRMLVVLKEKGDGFDEKGIDFGEFVDRVVLQFATHAHSPNLPKDDVSHLDQRLHNRKFHKRRSSESVPDVIVLSLFGLVGTGYEHSMQSFLVSDWYVVGLIFQFQMSEDFFLHLCYSSLVLAVFLVWQILVHRHSIIGQELQFDVVQQVVTGLKSPSSDLSERDSEQLRLGFEGKHEKQGKMTYSIQAFNEKLLHVFYCWLFPFTKDTVIFQQIFRSPSFIGCRILHILINFYSFFLSNCLPLPPEKPPPKNTEVMNLYGINPAPQFFFNYINIVQKMQVIINQGVKKYGELEEISAQQLSRYVESHPFYRVGMKDLDVAGRLWSALKKKNELGSRGQSGEQQYKKRQSLEQLGLYLNRQNNAQIFKLFEYILNNPKGLTYDQLSKRLKSDIITISHYCCKLKKLRLIDWDHEKDGVIVFPKAAAPERPDVSIVYSINKNESNYDVKESFLFRELSMTENIWINISSEDSIARGGLTNEEIKRKIMKHAENKMVRRTVESMKFFEKTAERQGKVFEFKYKNETDQIKQEINRKNEVDQSDEIESLDEFVLEWLKKKFPEFIGESFLKDLINNKFKDYFSSVGVKQSKRQCTPLKLNRYIKVLNYLHIEGGMKESELRNLIVRDQAQFNIGIMHKRSLMGILEGLKNLSILFEDDGFYYPGWIEFDSWTKRKEELFPKKMKEDYEDTPKKKVHLEGNEQKSKKKAKKNAVGDNNEKAEGKFTKITEAQYQLELFSTLLAVQIEKALKRCYRKAFHRIIYVERRKAVTKYVPQNHILHFLENASLMPSFSLNQSLSSFYQELDQIVEENSIRENIQCQPENELIKFIRKNPIKNSNFLRIKYGKSWPSKFEELTKQGIVQMDESGIRLTASRSFLI